MRSKTNISVLQLAQDNADSRHRGHARDITCFTVKNKIILASSLGDWVTRLVDQTKAMRCGHDVVTI